VFYWVRMAAHGTDGGIEHEAELRSTGRRLPAVLVLLVLVVAVVALLRDGGDADGDAAPAPPPTATPTSETLTTTRPARVPPVLAVADAGGGPVPTAAASDDHTRFPPPEATYEALQAQPLAVDGTVVVLADGGRLLAGEPGGVFERIGPDGPVSRLVPSNEPRHVWAGVAERELALVSLDGGEPSVRIPVGDDRVLGPASFGVVTVGPDGTVWWRRPSFEPLRLELPSGRQAVDVGGDTVLLEVAATGDDVRRFETWSLSERRLVRNLAVRTSDRPAILALDGRTAALPTPTGWQVLDLATGSERSRLPPSGLPGVDPVWVGGDHFAVAVGPHLVEISDSVRHRPRWPVVALAEASP